LDIKKYRCRCKSTNLPAFWSAHLAGHLSDLDPEFTPLEREALSFNIFWIGEIRIDSFHGLATK